MNNVCARPNRETYDRTEYVEPISAKQNPNNVLELSSVHEVPDDRPLFGFPSK